MSMKRGNFLTLCGSALTVAAFPAVARAGESDIVLQTATGKIYGSLSLPAGKKTVDVVLLIAGSGPTDRDGNNPALLGKNDALKLLAQGLSRRGLASVRYDKRGIGASGAAGMSEKDLRFDMYVGDAAAWVQMLHTDRRFGRIIIAGHSEGSLIGMIAAKRAPAAAYVSLEGAGRPAYTILREQLKRGFPAPLYAQADQIITSLQAGRTQTVADPQLQSLFRDSVQPYLISWFKYDPAVEIGRVRLPTTIVQGTADVQIGMADADALAKAAPRAKRVTVAGMNHVLKHAPDVSSQAAILRGYTDPKLPVDPQVINAVASVLPK
jgi:pimeloyl-ACP methyl ester carboxylesterase